MPCRTVHVPGHGVAIVCGRGSTRRRVPRRCVVCHVPETMASIRRCDGPGLRPGTTCDAPVCVDCAYHIDPDEDYCPTHAQAVADTWRQQRDTGGLVPEAEEFEEEPEEEGAE